MNKEIKINGLRTDYVKTYRSVVGTEAEQFEVRWTNSGIVVAKAGRDVLFVPANLVNNVANAMNTVNRDDLNDDFDF